MADIINYGDWAEYDVFEVEQDVYPTVDPSEELAEKLDADPTSDKVKLYSRIQKMSPIEKRLFTKILQQNALMDLISAMKNLKNTTKEEWERVIRKLSNLKDVKLPDKSGFDFSAFLTTLLPLVGALAATLLAQRDFEKKDSECAEPVNNPLDDPSFQEDATKQLQKSIVLQLCNAKENGFSL